MRPIALLVCLALAGCARVNPTPNVTAAAPVAAPAAARAQSPLARAAQASSQNDDSWKAGGVTREKINAMCWMRYEHGRNDMPVEARADLVEACVAQTLKQHPVR
jgi:hypothetical protein